MFVLRSSFAFCFVESVEDRLRIEKRVFVICTK
jgi:hypothetical protein